MPDVLTEEERAAIDAAIKSKKVQTIPQGTSGYAGYRYDPNEGKLVNQDPAKTFGWRRTGPRTKGPTAKVAQRRVKVIEMMQQGHSAASISETLGVGIHTIYSDAREMGRSFLEEKSNVPAEERPKESTKKVCRHDPVVQERRKAVKDAFDGKRTAPEIARLTGIPNRTVKDHLKALGLTAPNGVPGPRDSAQVRRAQDRRKQLPELVDAGWTRAEIGQKFGVTASMISVDMKKLGLKFPIRKSKDKAANKKAKRAIGKSLKLTDRRRFKTTAVPIGDYSKLAKEGSEGTMFPNRVFQPTDAETVLKDGFSNSKIGGDVLLGWMKGARIYTVTLEERATCPTTCRHWRGCYGNGMQYAQRWAHGPELIEKMRAEIAQLCDTHDRVLVRLHVLGDFWSMDYVRFWKEMLDEHANLFAFGFTAWAPGTEIGDYIASVRDIISDRFYIRHSETTGQWGSFTVDFPTEKKQIGDAIVCPEQRDGMNGGVKGVHCGNCGICWSTDRPIVFVIH